MNIIFNYNNQVQSGSFPLAFKHISIEEEMQKEQCIRSKKATSEIKVCPVKVAVSPSLSIEFV